MPSVQNVWRLSRCKGPLLRMVFAGEQVSLNGEKHGVLQGSNAAVTFFSTGDVVRRPTAELCWPSCSCYLNVTKAFYELFNHRTMD